PSGLIEPTHKQFTRVCGDRDFANERTTNNSAAFETPYAIAGGSGVKPPQLWTEIMLPLPCFCMSSVVSSARRHVAITLTSIASFHTSSVLSQIPFPSLP